MTIVQDVLWLISEYKIFDAWSSTLITALCHTVDFVWASENAKRAKSESASAQFLMIRVLCSMHVYGDNAAAIIINFLQAWPVLSLYFTNRNLSLVPP